MGIELIKTNDSSRVVFKRIETLIREVMEDGGAMIVDEARSRVPVHTFDLYNSIDSEVLGDGSISVTAGDEATTNSQGSDYSIFVEYGTVKMQARPFMEPAFEVCAPIIEANLANVLTGYRRYTKKSYSRRSESEKAKYSNNGS